VLFSDHDVSIEQPAELKTEGSLDPCSVGPLARLRSRKTKPSRSSASIEQPSEVMTALHVCCCHTLVSQCISSSAVVIILSCCLSVNLCHCCSITWDTVIFYVCLSVCDFSCGHNSRSKIEFIRGQNLTIPSHVFPIFTHVMHFNEKVPTPQ